MTIEQRLTTFIENEAVPSDANVVGSTWHYVNKSGGPDRRFNNNAQLPVVQYGVLMLKSSRGLNIHLHTSNAQVSFAVSKRWHDLKSGPHTSQSSPSVNTQNRPAVIT